MNPRAAKQTNQMVSWTGVSRENTRHPLRPAPRAGSMCEWRMIRPSSAGSAGEPGAADLRDRFVITSDGPSDEEVMAVDDQKPGRLIRIARVVIRPVQELRPADLFGLPREERLNYRLELLADTHR